MTPTGAEEAEENTLSWRVETVEETSSTNDLVSARAWQGEPVGLVVRAVSQTKGKGRRGRSWFSPPGSGLYFSALLRPGRAVETSARLTLLLGVAAAEGLSEATGLRIGLKWPNDLRVRSKKNRRNSLRIPGTPESVPRRRRRAWRQPHDAGSRFPPRGARIGNLDSPVGWKGSRRGTSAPSPSGAHRILVQGI